MKHTTISKQNQVQHSIAVKLLTVVFSIYLGVVLIVTIGQMTREYYHIKNGIITELHLVKDVFEKGLGYALWEADIPEVQFWADGIVKSPNIIGVRVTDSQRKKIFSASGIIISLEDKKVTVKQHKHVPVQKTDLVGDLFWYTFPVKYKHQYGVDLVGELTVYSSSIVVLKRIKNGLLVISLCEILKIIGLWVIFYCASRIMLLRPLSRLTKATKKIDFNNLEGFHVDIGTPGQNELKILEETFNTMLQKLLIHQQKLKNEINERKNAEHELKLHQSQLEGLVKKRTYDIEQINDKLTMTNAKLVRNLDDLERFTNLVVGREERMIQIKKEINELLVEMGKVPKYKIAKEDTVSLD